MHIPFFFSSITVTLALESKDTEANALNTEPTIMTKIPSNRA
jgi:hypothetical protein